MKTLKEYGVTLAKVFFVGIFTIGAYANCYAAKEMLEKILNLKKEGSN